MSDYETFLTKHNEGAAKFLDTQLNQYLNFVVKQLASHGVHDANGKKLSQKDLKSIVKGEMSPEPKSTKGKKKAKVEKDEDSSEDDQPTFPKGMTKAKWDKVCEAVGLLGEEEFVNVFSGKTTKKNKKNKDTFVFKGQFCAPLAHKALVTWAVKNQPAKEEKEEEEESLEFEDGDKLEVDFSEASEAGEPEGDDEEDEGSDEEEEETKMPKKFLKGWDKKKVEKLLEAAKKAKAKSEHINADSNRKVANNDKNKKKFVFTKHGIAIDRTNKKLQEFVESLY